MPRSLPSQYPFPPLCLSHPFPWPCSINQTSWPLKPLFQVSDSPPTTYCLPKSLVQAAPLLFLKLFQPQIHWQLLPQNFLAFQQSPLCISSLLLQSSFFLPLIISLNILSTPFVLLSYWVLWKNSNHFFIPTPEQLYVASEKNHRTAEWFLFKLMSNHRFGLQNASNSARFL